ncbi:cytochrome P450 [Suillus paluster]|uniref:cytochrome P450 n=1 Tax=Suillus paluster TaxID=48578 RepID=UPI001B87C5E5|nr:cytochrome P450 [Suillus paluster]KAG1736093.1 cytochrome P450 [Suillus paluster]
MIQERQGSQHQEDNSDILSSLLAANDDEKLSQGEVKLSDSELIGNTFILLVAGHEHIHWLLRSDCWLYIPTSKRNCTNTSSECYLMEDFLLTMICRHWPTRLPCSTRHYGYSPLYIAAVPKSNAEDTTFTLTDAHGTKRTVAVPRGFALTLDISGLHYNPKYWEDPYAFKPERFLGDWNRDAFLPFSSGYRACVGRKFSETEGTAVLTVVLSRYTVSVKDEPQFAGETFEQRKTRVLDARSRLTLAPTRLPLVFRRRI